MDYRGPEPDPQWQATLDAITPPGGRLSWLRLVWVPGEPWEPVHRWCIWQMIPIDRANEMVRGDLLGPSPRERGRYDRVLGRFLPDPTCNVSLQQWELYRQTGCYGRPYWICQGSRGGHKRTFTRSESAISKMNGGPAQPPLIGDLPYAVPDNRTFDKLAKLDIARAYSYLLDRVHTSSAKFDQHDEKIIGEMRTQVWKWLSSQVEDAVRSEKSGARLLQETARQKKYDEAFIERRLGDVN